MVGKLSTHFLNLVTVLSIFKMTFYISILYKNIIHSKVDKVEKCVVAAVFLTISIISTLDFKIL